MKHQAPHKPASRRSSNHTALRYRKESPSSPAISLIVVGPVVLAGTLLGFASDTPLITLVSTLVLQLTMVIWGYRQRPFGIVLVFFVVSCFTFLTGRLTVVGLFGYKRTEAQPWGLHLSDPDIINGVLVMQQVFLIGVWVAMIFLMGRRARRSYSEPEFRPFRIGQQVGISAMAAGTLLYLQNRLGVVSTVSSTSYYEYYSSQAELVSVSGRVGGALLIVGFAFVLASNPSFPVFVVAASILVANHALDLVMGRRADFVLSVLVVAFYAFLRASGGSRESREGWPRPQRLAIWSLAVFPLIALLNFVNRIRTPGQSEGGSEDFTGLGEFLYSQGVTANILAYIQTDTLSIPDNKFYSFGPLIEFVQTRLTPGFDATIYQGQTAERAISGHQFADIFSYRIMPTLYEQGAGYGSSAVAELFWDFGWFGILSGGIVIGFLMSFSSIIDRAIVPVAAVLYLIVRDLMYIPRAPFLHWLVGALNVHNILAIVGLTVLCLALQRVNSNRKTKPRMATRRALGGRTL